MPNVTGTTVTKAGDLNMGGYQRLRQPKRGRTDMFTAEDGGKELDGGPSTGHGAMVKTQKPVKNLKRALSRSTESTAERVKRLGR